MLNHYIYSGYIGFCRYWHCVSRQVLWLVVVITTGTAKGNAETLTTAEVRTLKNAVTVVQYQPQVSALATQCAADILQYLPPVVGDADLALLDVLLKQKLNITSSQLVELRDNNEKFASLTHAATVTMPDCSDREAILDLTEQFSNNFTALELSDPLGLWQQHFAPQNPSKTNTSGLDPDHIAGLISHSHSIVLVAVIPKSVLTPLQQANFLHIDDKSNYVFEVQQGWKAVAARYQGLHINISPETYSQQPKRWLLLLDARFHPKTALHGAGLQQALTLLGTPAWTFNRQGDLLRAKTISKP